MKKIYIYWKKIYIFIYEKNVFFCIWEKKLLEIFFFIWKIKDSPYEKKYPENIFFFTQFQIWKPFSHENHSSSSVQHMKIRIVKKKITWKDRKKNQTLESCVLSASSSMGVYSKKWITATTKRKIVVWRCRGWKLGSTKKSHSVHAEKFMPFHTYIFVFFFKKVNGSQKENSHLPLRAHVGNGDTLYILINCLLFVEN